jgi:hypothetical protein
MAKTSAAQPMLLIAPDVSVRRSYTLREDAATLLDDYATFLTDFTHAKVGPGDVIAELAARLAKDKVFAEWRRKKPSLAGESEVKV